MSVQFVVSFMALQVGKGISELFTVPEYLNQIQKNPLFFLQCIHCTYELPKKESSLKNQGGSHRALSLIWHWKSTFHHLMTQ